MPPQSKPDFVPEQLAAIEQQGPTLVSAAAGSGKTAVLTERAVRALLREDDPVSVDDLLILTFTKAAAAEMRGRIAARLREEMQRAENKEKIWQHLLLLPGAPISTLDAFCGALVREYGHALPGDTAGLKIADKGTLATLAARAMDDACATLYERQPEALRALLLALGADWGDDILRRTVSRLTDFLRAQAFPEEWLQHALRRLRQGDIDDWCEEALRYPPAAMAQALALLDSATAAAVGVRDPAARERALCCLREDRAQIEAACAESDGAGARARYEDAAARLTHLSFARWPGRAKDEADKAALADAKKRRDGAKGIALDQGKWFPFSPEGLDGDLRALLEPAELLIAFTREYMARLDEYKRERGVQDFTDVELAALNLLVRRDGDALVCTELGAEIAARYKEVLIDEYQDTNDLQDALVFALSGGRERLFVVGDVKQCIYRFRQANPRNFLALRDAFASPGSGARAMALSSNYRSRAGICDFVNFVFSRLMSEELGEIDYGPAEALVPRGSFAPNGGMDVELMLMEDSSASADSDSLESTASEPPEPADADASGGETDDSNAFSRLDREGEVVAARLSEMMRAPCLDDGAGGLRAPEYRDFAILLRAPTANAGYYALALARRGIPCHVEKGGDFLASREIGAALSVLRAALNPLRDVHLLAALFSPFLGFTPDEMARLRAAKREGPLYGALTAAARAGDEKCAGAVAFLRRLRRDAAREPADQAVEKLLRASGYLAAVQAMENGAQRRANLLLLLSYARRYEELGFKGLSGFLAFLDRMEDGDRPLEAAPPSAGREGAVRILSMHGAKGLQFPVCIVAGLGAKFNRRELQAEPVLFHSELGLGMKRQDPPTHSVRRTLAHTALLSRLNRELIGEELRLLYVGFTRASEKLLLAGTVGSLDSAVAAAALRCAQDGAGKLLPQNLFGASTPLELLLPCALLHPDGRAALAAYCSVMPDAAVSASRLTVSLARTSAPASQPPAPPLPSPDERLLREIDARLSYRYAYESLLRVAAKVTASRAAEEERTAQDVSRLRARPAFLRAEHLTPAERGTALHQFMQFADYISAARDVDGEIARLVERRFLSPVQGESIEVQRLRAFFESPLYARMSASKEMRREIRFLVEVPASRFDAELDECCRDEPVAVQGIMDCVFEEGGTLTIVDYKTDRVSDASELLARYRPQMEIYREALARVSELPVGQCLLYSFYLGREIEVG